MASNAPRKTFDELGLAWEVEGYQGGPYQPAPKFDTCSEGLWTSTADTETMLQRKMGQRWDARLDGAAGADLWIPRDKLVRSTAELLMRERTVVIRSTPMTGKTTLLFLLGKYLVQQKCEVEPIYVYWDYHQCAKADNAESYLATFEATAIRLNAMARKLYQLPLVSQQEAERRPRVWLIDEATNSYSHTDWWSERFKTRAGLLNRDYYVLACVHGSAHEQLLNSTWQGWTGSQAIRFPSTQRVELYSALPGYPQLLFTEDEVREYIQRWVIKINHEKNIGHTKVAEDVGRLVMAHTNGHPGIVGEVLCLFLHPDSAKTYQERARWDDLWTSELCSSFRVSMGEPKDLDLIFDGWVSG